MIASMQGPLWMLVRVAHETRPLHARADGDRLAFFDVATDLEYRRLLARVHGFEAAVAEATVRVGGLDPHVLASRTHVDELAGDLVALGADPVGVRVLPRPTVFIQTPAQALGWLFVVERNTLLAGLIRRALAARIADVAHRAMTYFDACVPAGARLRAFGEVLAAHVEQELARPEDIVTATRQAFHAQHDWYARVVRMRSRPISQPVAPLARVA
jgi:heme oxygenase